MLALLRQESNCIDEKNFFFIIFFIFIINKSNNKKLVYAVNNKRLCYYFIMKTRAVSLLKAAIPVPSAWAPSTPMLFSLFYILISLLFNNTVHNIK